MFTELTEALASCNTVKKSSMSHQFINYFLTVLPAALYVPPVDPLASAGASYFPDLDLDCDRDSDDAITLVPS